MILCVTPNPAVDRTLTVSDFHMGEVYRAQHTIVAAGGKGLNVARVITHLGADACCTGFLGGHSGRLFWQLLENEGLPGFWTYVPGETRTCVIVADAAMRQSSVINEAGPTIKAEFWAGLLQQTIDASVGIDAVCICGSLPPLDDVSTFQTWLADLQFAMREREIPVWVDSSGLGLQTALKIPGLSIKVNEFEAAQALGEQAGDPEWAVAAASRLFERMKAPVALTLGARGAVFVNAELKLYADAPQVDAVSTVGSGDSFLAGLIMNPDDLPELRLQRAVAVGAANTLSYGGGRFEMADYQRLLAEVKITRV